MHLSEILKGIRFGPQMMAQITRLTKVSRSKLQEQMLMGIQK